MQPRKILLSGALQGNGGIQTHFRFLLRALDEAGYHVLAISTNVEPQLTSKKPPVSLRDQIEFPLSSNIECLDASVSAPSKFGFLQKLTLLNSAIRRFQPNAIATVGHGVSNLLLGFLASRKTPRLYYEVMGIPVHGRFNPRRYYPWVYTHFAAQSQLVGQLLQQQLHLKNLPTVLPAFPQGHELTAPLPVINARAVPLGSAKAAFFGRLVPHKQPHLLAQHFAQIAETVAEYHIHGTGPETERIQKIIQENSLQNRVFLHGRYPDGAAYLDLMSRYDLLVLPTIGAEGIPLVLVEALACGVPFVACNTGGIADAALPNSGCIVTDQTPAGFLEGVHTVCRTLSNNQINRPFLQQIYLENFGFQACKSRWVAEIERMVREHRK